MSDIPDWMQEILTDGIELQPTEFFTQPNYDNIVIPVKEPKVKIILNEPDKTLKTLDRRIKSDGNITESFPTSNIETSESRTQGSYQKILDKSIQSLAKYRSIVS